MHYLFLLFISFFSVVYTQEVQIAKYVNQGCLIPNKGQYPEHILYKGFLKKAEWYVISNEQKSFLCYRLFDMMSSSLNDSLEQTPSVYQDIYLELDNVNLSSSNVIEEYFTDHYYNFLKGNNPSKYVSKVHGVYQLTFERVYDQIDLRLILRGQRKYEYVVYPGGNIEDISITIRGAKNSYINSLGQLIIENQITDIIEEKPYVYQFIEGVKKEVPTSFILEGNVLKFNVS